MPSRGDVPPDEPRCTECGCTLFLEVDGSGGICIACRHDVGERWLIHDERLLKGLPVEEED